MTQVDIGLWCLAAGGGLLVLLALVGKVTHQGLIPPKTTDEIVMAAAAQIASDGSRGCSPWLSESFS